MPKVDRMANFRVGVYFLICTGLIALGALNKNHNAVQLSILPIGLLAVLFHKFAHKGKLRELGFRLCSWASLGKAAALPVLMISLILLIDLVLGLVQVRPLADIENPLSGRTGLHLGSLILVILASALFTFLASALTEELGFRGYLLTNLGRYGDSRALLLSSLLFGLWHVPPSVILLGSGIARTVLYALNISLLGTILGYLFLESRSLIPCALCHGFWNALEYTWFGYGNMRAVLAGSSRTLFDPEEGLVGTFVLLVCSLLIFSKLRPKRTEALRPDPQTLSAGDDSGMNLGIKKRK